MRVQAWAAVNRSALVSTTEATDTVRLDYADKPGVVSELEALVKAETSCCGPAGVRFALEGRTVVVSLVTEGLPARTVLAAFAGMSAP